MPFMGERNGEQEANQRHALPNGRKMHQKQIGIDQQKKKRKPQILIRYVLLEKTTDSIYKGQTGACDQPEIMRQNAIEHSKKPFAGKRVAAHCVDFQKTPAVTKVIVAISIAQSCEQKQHQQGQIKKRPVLD